MAESRKKLLARNALYSAASTLVPVILAFVATPIIVSGLGNEIYGLYAVIVGFSAYSFTFAIGRAASKYVAEYRSSCETDRLSQAVSAVFWLSLGLAVVGSIVTALSARYVVQTVLQIPENLWETGVVAFYLACSLIVVTMLSQVFQFVLQGAHRFDLYLLLTNLAGLALNIGSIAIVLFGGGVLTLLVWNLALTALAGFAFFAVAKRIVPEISFAFPRNSAAWRPVVAYSLSIISWQIFGNVLLLFERGWIVRRFGTEMLTFYVVPMTIGIYLHTLVGSLVLSIFPVVNELLTDRKRLVRLYRISTKACVAIAAFAFATFAVTAREFLSLWMSAQFAEVSYTVLVIHVATFGILAVSTVALQISESVRRANLNASVTFFWVAIAIPLMLILADNQSIVGVATARLGGVLAFIPFIFYIESRFLGGVMLTFWASILAKTTVAVAVTAGSEVLLLGRIGGWPGFVIAAASGFVIYCTALLVLRFLDNDEFASLKSLATRGS